MWCGLRRPRVLGPALWPAGPSSAVPCWTAAVVSAGGRDTLGPSLPGSLAKQPAGTLPVFRGLQPMVADGDWGTAAREK